MSVLNIVPTNISYSSSILNHNINSLKSLYPFLEIISSEKSILCKDIPVIKIGNGSKEVYYSASIHRKRMDYKSSSYEIC